jgi:hypothetical protein
MVLDGNNSHFETHLRPSGALNPQMVRVKAFTLTNLHSENCCPYSVREGGLRSDSRNFSHQVQFSNC